METRERKILNIFFFLGLPVLILWQMLLPGYVLTLDMVFVPQPKIFVSDWAFLNDLPLQYFIKILSYVSTGWMAQKILLFALFFLLAYLPYRFLDVPDKYGARYFAALFYAVNPFVYERFLAGHIAHLFAYAFFPPIIYYAKRVIADANRKNFFLLLAWLLLIDACSLHLTVIAMLAVASIFAAGIAMKFKNGDLLSARKSMLAIIALLPALLLVFSYWLIPYIHNSRSNIVANIAGDQIRAFSAAGDRNFGVLGNLLGLYGFWGESQAWAQQFIWAKDHVAFWLGALSILLALVIVGIVASIRRYKGNALLLAALLASFAFSCGLSLGALRGFNLWLYAHVPFWVGFRDSTKFLSVTALAYAYFGGWGVAAMGEALRRYSEKLRTASYAFLLLPLIYTYPMLGGFARQLEPVFYPISWETADYVLSAQKEAGRALFLPWHSYMTFPFGGERLISSPASRYFGREVVQAYRMDLAGVREMPNAKDADLERTITANNSSLTKGEIASVMKKNNIVFIIFSHNLQEEDNYNYSFINSLDLEKIFDSEDLTIYKIVLK